MAATKSRKSDSIKYATYGISEFFGADTTAKSLYPNTIHIVKTETINLPRRLEYAMIAGTNHSNAGKVWVFGKSRGFELKG
jgi:hypothetical protein